MKYMTLELNQKDEYVETGKEKKPYFEYREGKLIKLFPQLREQGIIVIARKRLLSRGKQ